VRWIDAQLRGPAGPTGPRLLCSATPALAERMQVGSFRADLYARLTAHRLDLPPLRARDDKAALVLELLTELCVQRSMAPPELSPEALSALLARPWPGNVRQLRELLDAALRASSGPSLGVHELALAEAPAPPAGGPSVDLTDLTERALRAAFAEAQGNVSEAARRLGVARSSIYRMMARFGLR
jgi:transcriptional regulator of acetoin/glycerol metabolism